MYSMDKHSPTFLPVLTLGSFFLDIQVGGTEIVKVAYVGGLGWEHVAAGGFWGPYYVHTTLILSGVVYSLVP